jgi:hypothetical protein
VKYGDYWRRQRTIRQGIVIGVIVAFATVVFVGAIRVMTVDRSAQVPARTSPPVEYDDDFDDDPASQDLAAEPESP